MEEKRRNAVNFVHSKVGSRHSILGGWREWRWNSACGRAGSSFMAVC